MNSRKHQTAFVWAGVAAGAAAAAWLGRKHLRLVPRPSDTPRIEPPPIEPFLVHGPASELGPATEPEPFGVGRSQLAPEDLPPPSNAEDFRDLWRVEPEMAELDEGAEGYDAVAPEDLGTVWLSRATQTAQDSPHTRSFDQAFDRDLPEGLQELPSAAEEGSVTQPSIDVEMLDADESADDVIADDELDIVETVERTSERSGTKARRAASKAKRNHPG